MPLLTWFNNNFMKGNSDKSHLLVVLNHLQHLSTALSLNPIQKRYFYE